MTAHCLVIHPDATTEFVDISSGDDIHRAVGGDFDWSAPSALMFYCYQWALYERPINPVATELYHAVDIGARERGDRLAGDILVTGPPVASEETDIPDQYVTLFHKLRRRMGQMQIDRLAKPLSADEVTRMKADQDQLWAQIRNKLAQGHAVDVGGIIIGTEKDDDG